MVTLVKRRCSAPWCFQPGSTMSRSASDWCWEVSWSWPASTSERYVPPELTQRLWMQRLTSVRPPTDKYGPRLSITVASGSIHERWTPASRTRMTIDPVITLNRLVGTPIGPASGETAFATLVINWTRIRRDVPTADGLAGRVPREQVSYTEGSDGQASKDMQADQSSFTGEAQTPHAGSLHGKRIDTCRWVG